MVVTNTKEYINSLDPEDFICFLYRNGFSLNECSYRSTFSKLDVRDILVANGIEIRDRGYPPRYVTHNREAIRKVLRPRVQKVSTPKSADPAEIIQAIDDFKEKVLRILNNR